MNKKLLIALPILLIATATLAKTTCTPNQLLGSVDIGKLPNNEAHWLGWSGQQPATSGGTWGNPPTSTYWRTVSSVGDKFGDTAYASFIAKGDVDKIEIVHLDGIADDSFDVYVLNGWKWANIGHYTDAGSTETIVTTDFSIPKNVHVDDWVNVKIVLTGAHWDQYNTYGQLAIHSISAIGDKCTCKDRDDDKE